MTSDKQKKKTFGLFEEGRYQESIDLYSYFPGMIKEPKLETHASTNLYYSGKFEDAEFFSMTSCRRSQSPPMFRVSFTKVLESRGGEGAFAYELSICTLSQQTRNVLSVLYNDNEFTECTS